MYLLATDIVSLLLDGDKKVIDFLGKLEKQSFTVSIVSIMALMDERPYISNFLDYFTILELDQRILKDFKKLKQRVFAKKMENIDLMVAASAVAFDKILVTTKADFKRLRVVRTAYLHYR